MNSRNALAVMLKYPVPGRVKTRLTPALTPAEAAALYGCFIKDFFPRAASLECADTFGAYGLVKGADDKEKLVALLGTDTPLIAQEGSNLGERLRNLFAALFQGGYERVVVVGSDSPDLPGEYIEEAFALLGEAELVLGPALDGGYYLIGLKTLIGGLFDSIEWSTARVLDQTLTRAKDAGAVCRLLKPWHDIDTPEDLRLLKDNPMTPESSCFIKALPIRG
jgi:hypothetical protein